MSDLILELKTFNQSQGVLSPNSLFHGRKLTMRRYSPLLDEDNILLFYIKKAPLFKGKF